MRIVQVCGWYFPESLGGTETYVAALASCLRADGHDVRVAAPDPGADGERSYEHDGVPVFRYPVAHSPTRAEARHDEAARGADRLRAWLLRVRPDVVHVHTFVTGVGPHEIDAAKAAGARVIVTTHSGALGFLCQRGSMMRWGVDPCDGRVTPHKCSACALQGRGMPAGAASLLARLPPQVSRTLDALPGRLGTAIGMPALIHANQRRQRRMLGAVDAFVVLTDWARRAVLADSPGAPVVVNRLGVRTPPERRACPFGPAAADVDPAGSNRRRSPTASSGESTVALAEVERTRPTVAYVGRYDEVKGVADLAEAVRALPSQMTLRVEFKGPIQTARDRAVVDELRAIAAGDPRISIGDAVPPGDVYRYLESIDLLCCPSRTLEGGPTVALEAMAVGVPVVATRLGAMAEVLTDGVNGRLVPPGDVAALTDVLRSVVVDPGGTFGRWRGALPPPRTMRDVARDYLHLYQPASEVCA